jgi:Na+-transporting NADH:ubiquinone oxidoreductase subunit C
VRKESFARKRIFPVFFMLVVTVAFISATSVVYTFTADKIRLNQRLRLKRAVLYTAGVSVPADPLEIDRTYDRRVDEVKGADGKVRYFGIHAEADSSFDRYVIIGTGAGLWGEITVSVGFDADLESCTGLEIIDQNETPGLGGRISETWFKEQFRGKTFLLSTVPEGDPASSSEFQAITGATYTSSAVRDIANAAFEYARAEIAHTRGGDSGS